MIKLSELNREGIKTFGDDGWTVTIRRKSGEKEVESIHFVPVGEGMGNTKVKEVAQKLLGFLAEEWDKKKLPNIGKMHIL
jgi:hypothetical protein